MSYDLMIFEPGAAPKKHQEFLAWFRRRTKWDEGHSYGDPAVTSVHLQGWLSDMIETFPPLNEFLGVIDLPEDESSASDYSIGKQFVYVGFAWSKAETAYVSAFNLAAKHKLGFFNVSSSEEEVWLPAPEGLVLAHKKSPPTLLGRIKHLLHINSL